MLIRAKVWNIARMGEGTTVLLKPSGSNAAVPLFIGSSEAHSLLAGMHQIPLPRPLAHDIITNLLQRGGITLNRIIIRDKKEGHYQANLVFQQGDDDEFVQEARPSDALALCVRLGSPLYLEEEIIRQSSVRIEEDPPLLPTTKELEEDLRHAVEEENYEKAARLRDQIKSLKKGSSE